MPVHLIQGLAPFPEIACTTCNGKGRVPDLRPDYARRLPPEEERRRLGYWEIDGVRCCDLCTRGTSTVARQPVELRLICRPDRPGDRTWPPAACAGCAGEAWTTGVTIQDGLSPPGYVLDGADPRFRDAHDIFRERFADSVVP